jgi:hypothetical protein
VPPQYPQRGAEADHDYTYKNDLCIPGLLRAGSVRRSDILLGGRPPDADQTRNAADRPTNRILYSDDDRPGLEAAAIQRTAGRAGENGA